MPSLANRSLTRRMCVDALMLCVALMLSYLEAILPVHLVLPLPGFRFGWAQLAVTLTFFRVGKTDAAVISLARVLIMGLLFGSATTVYFSLCGSLLAYAGLWLGQLLLRSHCSFIGLGVLCAAMHNAGQLIAAATLFGHGIVMAYLPVLLVCSVVFGGLGGWVLNACCDRIPLFKGGASA
ncbi:MAG: Gx transporter family protein [Clostridia bacterium]|nr:Gx transporter family protein [Clostridia bacterium]